MQRLTPCLWFINEAEEAAQLYTSVFKNSRIGKSARYGDASAEVSGLRKGSVMAVDFEIAGQSVLALNGGPYYTHTSAVSMFAICGSREEVDAIHSRLSPGGKTLIELEEYPFSSRYAFFSDKFGVHWQVMFQEGATQKIVPCIIFGAKEGGYGPQALEFYRSLFSNSKTIMDERYQKGDVGKEGSIKHARLLLDGSELIIMDSSHDGDMPLTGAVSLIVNCKDQAEVDRYWDTIAKTGKELQCGWIEDKFGLSWQIVPKGMEDLLGGKDPAKSERAMKAMLQMKKLDINALKQAYTG